MSDDTRGVGIYISGYIAKNIKDRFEDCRIEYAVWEIKVGDADSANLKIISRGGLTVPSYSLSNYVCKAFSQIDYFNEIINKSDIQARTACEYTLINMLDSYQSISCLNHERKIELFVSRVIPNIILNNKRKLSTEFVPDDTIKSFKKRQRKIIIVLRKGTSIFLKIFTRFDDFVNKKQIKKTNISFRIMISALFPLCYIHFLQSFFKETGLLFLRKICSISGRVNKEGHATTKFDLRKYPYSFDVSLFSFLFYVHYNTLILQMLCYGFLIVFDFVLPIT